MSFWVGITFGSMNLNEFVVFHFSSLVDLLAKVGTTSPTSGGRSVGIVRSRTKATELLLLLVDLLGLSFNDSENLFDRGGQGFSWDVVLGKRGKIRHKRCFKM
jgi:hypothetical protein